MHIFDQVSESSPVSNVEKALYKKAIWKITCWPMQWIDRTVVKYAENRKYLFLWYIVYQYHHQHSFLFFGEQKLFNSTSCRKSNHKTLWHLQNTLYLNSCQTANPQQERRNIFILNFLKTFFGFCNGMSRWADFGNSAQFHPFHRRVEILSRWNVHQSENLANVGNLFIYTNFMIVLHCIIYIFIIKHVKVKSSLNENCYSLIYRILYIPYNTNKGLKHHCVYRNTNEFTQIIVRTSAPSAVESSEKRVHSPNTWEFTPAQCHTSANSVAKGFVLKAS